MNRGTLFMALAALAIVGATLLAPSPAQALTRAEFAAQGDVICRAEIKKSERAARKSKNKGKRKGGDRDQRFLRQEAGQAAAFAGAIDAVIKQLALIPAPPGDELIVAQWLDALHYDGLNYRALAALLRQKKVSFRNYFRETDTLAAHTQATDLLVDGFGFTFCASNTHYSFAVSAQRIP